MSRRQRLQTIIEIVGNNNIKNQSDLAGALRKAGFKVTQPTLSRDIAQLGLMKCANGYHLPEQIDQVTIGSTELRTIIRRFVTSMLAAENIALVKTQLGAAGIVAWTLDRAGWSELLGSVSGNDTILILADNNKNAKTICKKIERLLRS